MCREYLSKSINFNDLIDEDGDLYCGWKNECKNKYKIECNHKIIS